MARKLSKKPKLIKKVIKKTTSGSKKTKSVASKNLPKGNYIEGIGRRKVATARVRIYEGGGDFIVNDMAAGKYFANISDAQVLYLKPFDLTGTKGKFAVTVKVSGSGIRAQLDAVIHGLSRALVKYDPEFKILLKKESLLTRDDRMKESRKVGTGGKARRKRQSPKR
ncbi:MAG: 30S ribosomal protein S9 [Patescibacteria group bacterium]